MKISLYRYISGNKQLISKQTWDETRDTGEEHTSYSCPERVDSRSSVNLIISRLSLELSELYRRNVHDKLLFMHLLMFIDIQNQYSLTVQGKKKKRNARKFS